LLGICLSLYMLNKNLKRYLMPLGKIRPSLLNNPLRIIAEKKQHRKQIAYFQIWLWIMSHSVPNFLEI